MLRLFRDSWSTGQLVPECAYLQESIIRVDLACVLGCGLLGELIELNKRVVPGGPFLGDSMRRDTTLSRTLLIGRSRGTVRRRASRDGALR